MELPSRVACPLILQMNLGFSGIWLGQDLEIAMKLGSCITFRKTLLRTSHKEAITPFEAKLF
jgi:hypothetical protein